MFSFEFAALSYANAHKSRYRYRLEGFDPGWNEVDSKHRMILEARVGERTRIARELHDTLLQGFHGLLLRFQTASYLLPDRPRETKEKLEGAIGHAAKAITEGRDAVQGLRTSTVDCNDLPLAVRTLGDELATDASAARPPTFHVALEGQPRGLHPVVRDEIYKIAAEALRNAFRHAMPGMSRSSSDMTRSSGCACETTAAASIPLCSLPRVSRDTTDFAACQSGPRSWEASWRCGAKSALARR